MTASMKDLFELALRSEGVTGPLAEVARSIYLQESGGGKNTKTSNAGAVGGMQIIPSTFARVADKGWDIGNPEHNARAGIRYLKQLDKQSGGDPALTAAGYYGGPGGLEKARRGVAVSDPRNPNAPDTLEYGRQVAARLPGSTQVAQAPVVSPVVQEQVAAVPLPVLAQAVPTPAPVIPAWQAFQQAMPAPVIQAEALDYGPMTRALAQKGAEPPPMNYGPSPSLASVRPDFRAFSPLRGRLG